MNPKISVLICTYNCEKYIENTLNSVLDQTFKDFDILICENNSKDNTKNILKRYNKKYPKKIKIYYKNKNLGPYKGLNYLLDRTNAKYIAIQDHDDIWHPKKLKEQYIFLENNKKYNGCGTNSIYYYEKIKKYKFVKLWNKIDYFAIHTSLLFINRNYRYNEKEEVYVDGNFMKYNLCHNNKKIYNIQKPFILHIIRKDNNNLSSIWERNPKEKKKREKLFTKDNISDKIIRTYRKILNFNLRLKLSEIIFYKKYHKIKELKKNKILNKYKKYIK